MKDLVNEDPVQLKQTIIYLRAELNKYQSKDAKATSASIHTLQTENNRLKEEQRQLLHTSKKLEKRLFIYEKRIATLQTQNEKLTAQLSSMEKTFQEEMMAAVEPVNALTEVVNTLQQFAERFENVDRSEDPFVQMVEQLQAVSGELEIGKNVSVKLLEELQTTVDRMEAKSADRVEKDVAPVLEQLQGIAERLKSSEKGKDVSAIVLEELQILGDKILASGVDRVENVTALVLEQTQGIVEILKKLEKGDIDSINKTSTVLLEKLEAFAENMKVHQQKGISQLEMVAAQLLEKQQVVLKQLEGYEEDGKLTRERLETTSTQVLDNLQQILDTLTKMQDDVKQKEELLALNADKKHQIQALNVELHAQKTLHQTQRELIQVLETYVERLAIEPEELHTDSILQQIIALTEAYANKQHDYM